MSSLPPPANDVKLVPQRAQDREEHGKNAFNSERPLGVTPVPEGPLFLTLTNQGILTRFRWCRDRRSAKLARGTSHHGRQDRRQDPKGGCLSR